MVSLALSLLVVLGEQELDLQEALLERVNVDEVIHGCCSVLLKCCSVLLLRGSTIILGVVVPEEEELLPVIGADGGGKRTGPAKGRAITGGRGKT